MQLLSDVDKYAIKGRDKETDVHLWPKWEQTCSDKKDWNLLCHFKFIPILWVRKEYLKKNKSSTGKLQICLKAPP